MDLNTNHVGQHVCPESSILRVYIKVECDNYIMVSVVNQFLHISDPA